MRILRGFTDGISVNADSKGVAGGQLRPKPSKTRCLLVSAHSKGLKRTFERCTFEGLKAGPGEEAPRLRGDESCAQPIEGEEVKPRMGGHEPMWESRYKPVSVGEILPRASTAVASVK